MNSLGGITERAGGEGAQSLPGAAGLANVIVEGAPTAAIWVAGRVLPLADAARVNGIEVPPPGSARRALAEWERWCDVIATVAGDGQEAGGWLAEDEVSFLPALTDPPNIYCAAANYLDHMKEMSGKGLDATERRPLHFLASTSALNGHRQPVVRPQGCERFDWEVELAVVIGRNCHDVDASDAAEVIAAFCVANDLSLRDFARRDDYGFFPDWLSSKCYRGCLPLGPALVPASMVADPMALDLRLSVNGEVRQDSNTRNMIFSVAQQIEYLSHIAGLQQGDVIITGTPAGTARAWGSYLAPGDVVVAEVEGIGRLETRVEAPAR